MRPASAAPYASRVTRQPALRNCAELRPALSHGSTTRRPSGSRTWRSSVVRARSCAACWCIQQSKALRSQTDHGTCGACRCWRDRWPWAPRPCRGSSSTCVRRIRVHPEHILVKFTWKNSLGARLNQLNSIPIIIIYL
jgi:hypothetical protein